MSNQDQYFKELLGKAGFAKTVYSLVMPETEHIVDGISGDTGSSVREAFHDAYRGAWTQKQDPAHQIFFETWKKWNSSIVSADWDQFPYMYPTGGASEGLRDAIQTYGAKARVEGFEPTIHVFNGEYEGFTAYANAAGIPIQVHDRTNWQDALDKIGPNDQFYLSQPSAIDGNVWEDYDAFAFALNEMQPRAQLMLDLTYVGCVAKEFHVKADYPNIPVVFFSLSKPAGAYYHRIGGFLSREPYDGLFGNMWFKNLLSLNIGTEFMKAHGVRELPSKYASVQQKAIEQANRIFGFDLKASDVFLLSTMPPNPQQTDLERHLTRGSGNEQLVRLCLTPAMAGMIDAKLNPDFTNAPDIRPEQFNYTG